MIMGSMIRMVAPLRAVMSTAGRVIRRLLATIFMAIIVVAGSLVYITIRHLGGNQWSSWTHPTQSQRSGKTNKGNYISLITQPGKYTTYAIKNLSITLLGMKE